MSAASATLRAGRSGGGIPGAACGLSGGGNGSYGVAVSRAPGRLVACSPQPHGDILLMDIASKFDLRLVAM